MQLHENLKPRRFNMKITSKQITIFLIFALILAVFLTIYVGFVHPIIGVLGVAAVIVILLNLYLEKVKK